MRLLLLNTCGAEGSAALADSSLHSPIVAQQKMPGRTASEHTVVAVRGMLADAHWRLADLAAIAVVTGPGSFTGVRIGLSVAKGLSEASGVPLIAISRLALLASASGHHQGRVCTLLDAGRGEFYCGEYYGTESLSETLVSRDKAAAVIELADRTVICEETVLRAFLDVFPVQMLAEPTAKDALPHALKRLQLSDFDDSMTLDANYLRRTDAEIFAKSAVKRAG